MAPVSGMAVIPSCLPLFLIVISCSSISFTYNFLFLSQAFIQKVAELNLINRMRRMEEVKRIIRLTMGLPLLPEDLIIDGFFVILRHSRNEGNYIHRLVKPYLTYVWRHWVSRPWRRRRMTVYGSRQRTNNACESQNKTLREEAGTHSNVYMFIGKLFKVRSDIVENNNIGTTL